MRFCQSTDVPLSLATVFIVRRRITNFTNRGSRTSTQFASFVGHDGINADTFQGTAFVRKNVEARRIVAERAALVTARYV